MKVSKQYVLITFLIFQAFEKIQGQNDFDTKLIAENKNFYSFFPEKSREKNFQEIGDLNNKEILRQNSFETQPSFEILKTQLPPPTNQDSKKQQFPLVHDISHNYKNSRIPFTKQNRQNVFPKKLYSTENYIKKAKSNEPDNQPRTSAASHNVNYPILRTSNSQRIYCQQIIKSELNSQGVKIDNVEYICNLLPSAVSSFSPQSQATKDKRFDRLISSTPAGINCRRVMNSELNELGEIVDSVVEVCDPPPTTTTTTTKKPVLHTKPKVTTTTPKPLVKVCWPVMDSYLDDEGKIIDSVNIVCKMKPAD